MSSNYPEYIQPSAPAITGRDVITWYVECEEEEVIVVPSYKAKEQLMEIRTALSSLESLSAHDAAQKLPEIQQLLTNRLDDVYEHEDVGRWHCTFTGDVELTVTSEDRGVWDCPLCGTPEIMATLPNRDEEANERAREEAIDARFE